MMSDEFAPSQFFR